MQESPVSITSRLKKAASSKPPREGITLILLWMNLLICLSQIFIQPSLGTLTDAASAVIAVASLEGVRRGGSQSSDHGGEKWTPTPSS